ncbi:hypothetical protein GCM10023186_17410 [Hymenobacter koreensis]|uniref:T9SS type A sorting domain-containing protein n=2 Tax=Hymenobacter koreensis TaxID=1084523 RepID=A0ABP8IYA9_9BACT
MSFAQAPAFNLALGIGTTTAGFPQGGIVHDSYVHNTATDPQGNVYVVGRFQHSVDFGSFTLTSAGDYDVYVAKIDPSGVYQWAHRFGNRAADNCSGLVVDAAGNVYLAGSYRYSATFGTTTLSGPGISEGFLTKLNTNGRFLWAFNLGGSNAFGSALALDAGGDLLVHGGFSAPTARFGPYTIVNTGTPPYVEDNAFVAKCDTSGAWRWAVRAGRRAGSVAVDAFSNVYVAGSYGGTMSFGTHSLASQAGGQDAYVGKLDAQGNWLWVRGGGGPSYDYGAKVDVDYAGNVFLVGGFNPPYAAFGSLARVNNRGNGNFDGFIAKLDAQGNWLWANGCGGTDNDYAISVAVDHDGTAYVLGAYQDYGPGATFGSIVMPNLGRRYGQLFLGKVNAHGAWQWVTTTNGTYTDYPQALFLDYRGGVYVSGSFTSPQLSFSGIGLTQNPGGNTGFVARLGDSALPAVAQVTPPQGGAGTRVLLRGARLSGASTVLFNGVPALSYTVTSPTTIEAIVPAGASSGPVSVRTAAGLGTPGFVFQVGLATGSGNAVALPDVHYWPNPVSARGHLNITLQQSGRVVQVGLYTLQGQLLLKRTIAGREAVLELPAIPRGVYMLEVRAAPGQVARQRLVVE